MSTDAADVAARYDSRSRRSGNAQKDALNGNFAALGDNWALRRHVIIPATAAKAGSTSEIARIYGLGVRRPRGVERASERGELFSFRTTLMALFFGDPTNPRRFPGLALT